MAMNRLGKWWQRQVLDSLMMNPPPPLTIILMVVFGSVFGVGFLCAHWIDQVDLAYYKPFSILTDNIGGVAFNVMSDILPVDVVYTWVNGSDPKLLQDIEALTKSNFSSSGCNLQNCFYSNYYCIRNYGENYSNSSSEFIIIKTISHAHGAVNENVLLIKLKKYIDNESLEQRAKVNFGHNSTIHQTYWTSASKFEWEHPMSNTVLLRLHRDNDLQTELKKLDPDHYEEYLKSCVVHENQDSKVLECNDANLVIRMKRKVEDYRNLTKLQFPKAYSASLLLKTDKRKTKIDMNRFGDNEELRYSLRSLEKFAPWVRRIFIVTNGQVPYWLDLDHPKLTIITHEQIFKDYSHLPSYSSPAIESHIHRIPGLANHFIYFNDDIMLGAPVYPDDFYSISEGYKVYLTWSLPECSQGCPGSWIRDGYCDQACNTSNCDWDGGDCTGTNKVPEFERFASQDDVDECHTSCSNSWLADGYCDPVCSTLPCGFDAGDCGVEILKKGVHLIEFQNLTNRIIHLPNGSVSAWMDLSALFPDDEITREVSGFYKRTRGVRLAAVNTKNKVAVWIFKFNSTGVLDMRLNVTRNINFTSINEKSLFFKIYFNTRSIISLANNKNKSTGGKEQPIQHFSFANYFPKIKHAPISANFNSSMSNETFAKYPPDMQQALKDLNKLFEDGSLTDFGLNVKRDKILKKSEKKQQSKHLRKLMMFEEDKGTFETYKGHFPWEKKLSLLSVKSKPKVGRKLLDDFSSSLLYVNRLYNSEYGFEARKVPAHMPHFIDKNVLEELQEKYSTEFYATSSHKLREGNDMQFAFSYFYFLMNEKIHKSHGEIFDQFDTDHSGTWSDREIRTFLVKTNALPLRYDDVMGFHKDLKSCYESFSPPYVSVKPYERYADSDLPTISKELVIKCGSTLINERLQPLETKHRFKYSIVSDPSVDFKMITSNLSTVIYHLDEVRRNNKKFVCLNSDMDPRGSDNELIHALVQDTYESLYPVVSSFELPPNYRNRFSYIVQVRQWKVWRNILRALIYASVACLVILVALTFFNNELESFKRKWCKKRRRKIQQLDASV